jgi:hypothetical protein
LLSSLTGNYLIEAQAGRIYKFNLMAKLFALLNITEIFRGKLPDLSEEGFSYESIKIEGVIEGSKVIIDHGFIDGSSMGIMMKGEIDLLDDHIDLAVLVSPFKTVDFIVQQTPIIKSIIKGGLVSIPIEIKGSLSNPAITAISPASVDTGLLRILKNTLRIPITLIEPFIKEEEKER